MLNKGLRGCNTCILVVRPWRWADKDYTLVPFPCERHVPRGVSDRMYMERRIFHFFQAALAMPPAPLSPDH